MAIAKTSFDTFLSFNSKDRDEANALCLYLRQLDIAVWFDETERQAGISSAQQLTNAITESATVTVFLGPKGLGPVQQDETELAVDQARRQGKPIIPVLLPGVSFPLPHFLPIFAPIQFIGSVEEERRRSRSDPGSPLVQLERAISKAPPGAVREREIMQLFEILEGSMPGDYDAYQVFRQERGITRMPARTGKHEGFRDFVRQLADVVPEGPQLPLLRYLDSCRRHFPNLTQRTSDDLDVWIERIAKRLGREKPTDAVQSAATSAVESVDVLIKIEPDKHTDDHFLVEAWLVIGGNPESPFFASGTSLPRVGLALMPSMVLDALYARYADLGAELNFELFLPFELLCDPVERWELKVGRQNRCFPVGTIYNLKLRSYERAYDRKNFRVAQQLLRKKWVLCQGRIELGAIHTIRAETDYSPALMGLLSGDKIGAVFALQPPPGEQLTYLEDMITAGIPVILWQRKGTAKSPTAKTILGKVLTPVVTDWAQQLRALRHGALAKPNPFWQETVLIVDDPGKLPPDRSNRLQAPKIS